VKTYNNVTEWNDLGKYCWTRARQCTFNYCYKNSGCDYSKLKVILLVLNNFTKNLFGSSIKWFELLWVEFQKTFYNPHMMRYGS
jgi:hypothetical protein